MKRSFKNLFMIIAILVTSFASGLDLAPAQALGTMTFFRVGTGFADLPGGVSQGYLKGIWGADANHIFSVGYADTGTGSDAKPLIYQTANGGSTWTSSLASLPSGWTNGSFETVWGTDATHLIAVGKGSTEPGLPLVAFGDGTTWVSSSPGMPSSSWTSGVLHSVWGSSLDDIYAVGFGSGPSFTNMPLIYHWNGSIWSSSGMTLPPTYAHAELLDIWGSASNNIYIAAKGQDSGSTNLPLLFHYNGTGWSPITLTLPSGWTWGRLDGIWGSTTTGDIYAVGTGSNGTKTAPLIYHSSDGVHWSGTGPALPASTWSESFLYRVWGSGNEVYAVGAGLNLKPGISMTMPLLYRLGDNGWVASGYPPSGYDSGHFQAVWGYGTNNLYVVGDGSASGSKPLIWHAGSDGTPPGPVVSLGATAGTAPASVTLQWTAPADDGPNPPDPNMGAVNSYVVRYSEADNLTACDDSDGTPVTSGLPTPVLPGTTQTMTITGLTASTTYYFSVCAKDEEDNISSVETTSAISSSTGLLPGIYDDTDSNWIYTGTWNTYSGSGPYNSTLHYAGAGSDARMSFNGVRFTLTYTKTSNRGLIDVYVDGAKVGTINAYNSTTVWQASWTSPTFTPGIHTVRFAYGGGSTYIDIDKIQIFGVASAGIYDDTDANWAYVGAWSVNGAPSAYNTTLHSTNTVGNQAQFTFSGVKFALTYYKASSRGLIDVYVDDVKIGQINAKSTTAVWQAVWTSTFLTPGVHTVRFVHAGTSGAYIDIDKIQIFDGVIPGIYDDRDANWAYKGTWTNYSGTGPYSNTSRYTSKVGNEAQFAFNGIRFRFTYLKASSRGLIDVYVDGVKIDRINAKSTTMAWQQTWTSPNFMNSVHVVRFVHAGGGTYIDVDAIEIFAPTDLVKPAAIGDLSGGPGTMGGSVNLSWTAVGDDGTTGTATGYLVRYSASIINSENAWASASVFSGTLPPPSAPGNTDSLTVSGLSPDQAYYFAVRAMDDEGNLGDLSNSPLIVAQSPGTVPPGIYDDTDGNWIYTGTWLQYSGTGPYNNTQHYTGTVGNQAQISIEGVKFIVTYIKAASRGLIDVYVDGVKVGQINAKSTSTAWQQTWTSPVLTNAVHTVRFVHAGGGTYIDIDKIEVVEAASAGIYDETDPKWIYTGTWATYTGAGPYGGSTRYTNTVGNAAQIIISGVRFQLTYLKASTRGLIDVYVDGVKVGQINAKGTTTAWQQTWTSPTLTAGVHVVRFVHAGGGTYIDIDAIEILSSTDLIAPAAITNLSGVAGSTGGSVTLSWTSVGDDGNTGTATSYLVRYSSTVINTESAWTNASVFSGTIPAPSAPGNTDSVTVMGLTPSTTYYFAVRAMDEEGNVGLLSNSPAVVSQAPGIVPAGVYDDTDGNWLYTGTWTLYSGTGPYNNTQHYASTIGSEAQISFAGVKFTLTYLKASSRGLIDVIVDGTTVGQINAYNSATTWQQTWTSPILTAGTHTVRFVYAGNGSYIDIDKIQIFAAPGAGTYDDPDSMWVYTGTWTVTSTTGPYNNTLRYTNTVGNEAQFVFNGTGFRLTFVKASNRGLIDVYVDGTKIDQINANNPTIVWQATWDSPVLTAGVHTVRFVHAGSGTYIDVDAITIFP